ncbi:hypothetical protein DZS_00660 [Dickeya ananatis]
MKILMALVAMLMENQKNQFGQPQGGSGGGSGAAPVSGGNAAPSVGGTTPAAGGGVNPVLSGTAPETGGIAPTGASHNASELTDSKGGAPFGMAPAPAEAGSDTGKATV